MARPAQRGPYAKGELKREEILDHAVDVFGKYGYHATSMREIATACGLSQAGLLHYYPNKETLLLALVERREVAQTSITPNDVELWVNDTLRQEAQNRAQKPLTQLWANLVGEATDPAFPAHDFFVKRYRNTRKTMANQLAAINGRSEPTEEDETKGAILAAVWDGLQNQWLLDPKFDMKRPFEYALGMLTRYSQFK
jgi:AcrR family transcriptional regulator